MHERSVSPRSGGVTAGGPKVFPVMIVYVEIEAETIAVELHGTIEV
jgi:hypothetical protein